MTRPVVIDEVVDNAKRPKSQRVLFTVAVAAATLLAATAGGICLSIGSLSPCDALHSKARATVTGAAMKRHGDAPGRGVIVLLINALPIESMMDGALIERFGSAGPLQCAEAFFQIDWTDYEARMERE